MQIGSNRSLLDSTENTNAAYAHYLAAAAALSQNQKENLPGDTNKVDGEAFFITNASPLPFWDFTRLVWGYAGDTTRSDEAWVLSKPWALLLAGILEWMFWALGRGEAPLTRTKVRRSCMTRYFCIDKARRRLGYGPLVRLGEGLRYAVEDCVGRRGEARSFVDGDSGEDKGG